MRPRTLALATSLVLLACEASMVGTDSPPGLTVVMDRAPEAAEHCVVLAPRPDWIRVTVAPRGIVEPPQHTWPPPASFGVTLAKPGTYAFGAEAAGSGRAASTQTPIEVRLFEGAVERNVRSEGESFALPIESQRPELEICPAFVELDGPRPSTVSIRNVNPEYRYDALEWRSMLDEGPGSTNFEDDDVDVLPQCAVDGELSVLSEETTESDNSMTLVLQADCTGRYRLSYKTLFRGAWFDMEAIDPDTESESRAAVIGLDIQTRTQKHDAAGPPQVALDADSLTDPDGVPVLSPGDSVKWTYVVTNFGRQPLSGVAVTDSAGAEVTCLMTELAPIDGSPNQMTCEAYGVATGTVFRTLGHVTARTAQDSEVEDSDPSHYRTMVGPVGIDIEKHTNGQDADAPPGPTIFVDSTVNWTYVVTNTGSSSLTSVTVTDNKGVAVNCSGSFLGTDAHNRSMVCTGTGTATAGQYANVGTATGISPLGPVMDSDPSHYFGITTPVKDSIDIEKHTNGDDADTPTGPIVPVSSVVTWTYIVRNMGQGPLSNVVVTDSRGVAVSCSHPTGVLAPLGAPGDRMTCTASDTAVAGQYANMGTVVARTSSGGTVTDSDPSHYFGTTTPRPDSIAIEKHTEGVDADVPPGPALKAGATVVWTYQVENLSSGTLIGVTVTDDQGVTVYCPRSILGPAGSPSASMECEADDEVVEGPYSNVGTVTAATSDGAVVTASDPSHYLGVRPPVRIEKHTQGQDADLPPGPVIAAGDTVRWTYMVTNRGPGTLTSVTVTDDRGVSVACPASTLGPAGSSTDQMTCEAIGTAVAGQYVNVGTVAAITPQGHTVTDSDTSHYFGQRTPNSMVDIEKFTNGHDADSPTGPIIAVGGPVTWTYVATNTGAAALSSVAVTDDQGVTVSCPRTDLGPKGSSTAQMTCQATGTAVAGQYANVGTVTASGAGGTATDSDASHYVGADGAKPSISVDLVDFDIPTANTIANGRVRITNQSQAPAIYVTQMTYIVEVRSGNMWVALPATCVSTPSPTFSFVSAQDVDFGCTLGTSIASGSTVRITAAVDIFNRNRTFLDRLSKRF